jgi:adenylyl cyclase-associated protein
VITETAINQVVDVYNCRSSTIQIKGKVNAVNLLNCAKVAVLLDSTVSALSITASPGFTVQVTGTVPTILVDSTDGGQIYLGRQSLETEIITAKCSGLNVSLPVEGEEEGVFTECAVPEQLKTVIKAGKLATEVVEHAG